MKPRDPIPDSPRRYTVKRVVVRYKVKPELAAENVELVRGIYA